MLQHGLNGNYEVVPNVVDEKKFVPGTAQHSDKIRFLHVSSLIEREKNVSGILRAFKNALNTILNLELTIIGEGENKVELKALCDYLEITAHVNFKGRVVGEELIRNMQNCDALVMFSHYETFCLVNIEAFACGKPVITSNAGAIPGYMNEQLGIMVKVNDEKALCDAMVRFAKAPKNYDATYIRNFAMQFSYGTVGKQLDEIYQKALK